MAGDDRRWSRREVLGLAASLSWAAVARADEPAGGESGEAVRKRIAAAEWLTGLTYTDAERELMTEGIQQLEASLARARAVPLTNAVPPALGFDPRAATASGTGPEPNPATGTKGGPATGSPRDPASGFPEGRPSRVPTSAVPRPDDRPPGDEAAVAFAGVRQLAGWLAGGKLSARELADLYLARLQRHDPELQCVITLLAERARQEADDADRRRARGAPVPVLCGIPWGAKDLIALPGAPTTWGAEPYREQRFDEPAVVAERLAAAGAPVLAKLSVGALAWGDVWFGGDTKNPWNLEQGSSGSSAGSAAATAAGLVGFALGTETWGSVISPCTRCGATGLRPTFGRIPRTGVMALSWSMDKVGVIARSAEDCAFVFDVLDGPDRRDPDTRAASFAWPDPSRTRGLRVGYVPSLFDEDRTEGIEDLTAQMGALDWAAHDRRFLETLEGMGVSLRPIDLPADLPIDALTTILTAEASAAFDDLLRSGRAAELRRQTADAWPNEFRQGQLIPAVEYLRANRIRTLLVQRVEALFSSIDLYVTPTYGGNNLLLTNLTGHPGLVLPNGFRSTDGTPTSITLTGRLDGESELLALAMAYQERTDHHRQRPPVGR